MEEKSGDTHGKNVCKQDHVAGSTSCDRGEQVSQNSLNRCLQLREDNDKASWTSLADLRAVASYRLP
uniref:Uncharacterized protein n=1 Tax=Amphimedon queenslandica TaxID=400682 RepID=A0A1X7UZU7_AMPQE